MQIYTNGEGLLGVVANSAEDRDALALFYANHQAKLVSSEEVEIPVVPAKRVVAERKPRKTPLHKKKCVDCHRMFKGMQGLNKHRNAAHKRVSVPPSTHEGMTRLPVHGE